GNARRQRVPEGAGAVVVGMGDGDRAARTPDHAAERAGFAAAEILRQRVVREGALQQGEAEELEAGQRLRQRGGGGGHQARAEAVADEVQRVGRAVFTAGMISAPSLLPTMPARFFIS